MPIPANLPLAPPNASVTNYSNFLAQQTLATGNVWYVQSSSTTASDSIISPSHGLSPQLPFKTLNFALSQCTPNQQDRIYVLPGHVESVNAAAALTFAVGQADGVTVIFCGNETDRATINFLTSTAAQITIPAANVTLINPRFTNAIDALVAGISITGADCKIYNAQWLDGTAIYATIQLLTSNAANRLTIDGYTYYEGTAGTTKTEAIRIVGGKGHRLFNLNISGTFSTACLNNITTASTNLALEQSWLNNLNTGTVAAAFLTATTGVVVQTLFGATTGTTAAAFWTQASMVADAASGGVIPGSAQATFVPFTAAVPVTSASLLTSSLIEQSSQSTAPKTLPASTTTTYFTVTGEIEVLSISGQCTTVVQSQATTFKFSVNVNSLGSVDVCATGDLNAFPAGGVVSPITSFATALGVASPATKGIVDVTAKATQFIMGGQGLTSLITATTVATSTGAFRYFLRWRPISSDAAVVAA